MQDKRRWWIFLIALNSFSIMQQKSAAFVLVGARNVRLYTNLHGVLSPSQIMRASSNIERRGASTAPDHNSVDYYHLVLVEIKSRQKRIFDALQLELKKDHGPSAGKKEDSITHKTKASKKLMSITERKAEITIVLNKIQDIEKDLKRRASLPLARQSIIELGFESILTESPDKFTTQQTIRKEFGRPNGYDGLIFYTPLGVPILVGKKGSHSDETLRRISQGMDLWFQIEGYCGSRVLLRTSLKKSLKGSKMCIQMAADLAAYYSDYRWENEVPIMYTDSRHVAKRGTKKGQMKKQKSFGRIIGHPKSMEDVAGGKEP